MADTTLTRERIAELRRKYSLATCEPFEIHRYDCDDGDINYQLQQESNPRNVGQVLTNMFESTNANNRADAAYLCDLLNTAPALLSAAESALELRDEMRELRRTVAKHHGEAHAAREERDRLQVELDELKALASKSELAMAEDWRLATTAAAALKEERDRLLDERELLRARYADLQIACNMYETSIDRLDTFVNEEYGMQPVAESSEALVSMLEQLAFERRQQDEAERKERDRLQRRVEKLEDNRSRAVELLNTGAPFCEDCHSEGCAFTAEAYMVLTKGSAALVREEPSE